MIFLHVLKLIDFYDYPKKEYIHVQITRYKKLRQYARRNIYKK